VNRPALRVARSVHRDARPGHPGHQDHRVRQDERYRSVPGLSQGWDEAASCRGWGADRRVQPDRRVEVQDAAAWRRGRPRGAASQGAGRPSRRQRRRDCWRYADPGEGRHSRRCPPSRPRPRHLCRYPRHAQVALVVPPALTGPPALAVRPVQQVIPASRFRPRDPAPARRQEQSRLPFWPGPSSPARVLHPRSGRPRVAGGRRGLRRWTKRS
jgi:hypothetical protein